MFKTIGLWLGGGIIVFFIGAMFFPAVQDASGNATIQMGNITNATGLESGIAMTPLILIVGLLSIPLIGIVLYLWQRRVKG